MVFEKNFGNDSMTEFFFIRPQRWLGQTRSPPHPLNRRVGQIAENFQKFSVFRGWNGRYASVAVHIAPGCGPHVCYEPAKDGDHRPSGHRDSLDRNSDCRSKSPQGAAWLQHSEGRPKIEPNPKIESSSELIRSWDELWWFLDVQLVLQADCNRFWNRSAPPELTITVFMPGILLG